MLWIKQKWFIYGTSGGYLSTKVGVPKGYHYSVEPELENPH